ncbi:MAG: glycosyl transferase [Desulfobulbaceae bacterium A2]|nr:MAG: glycosyl transferase [Desulfobulbaceae bacterium A2]
MKAAVIIPVYNHGSRVGEVVRRALTLALPLIVVDDGSTDDTVAVLAAIPGITLRCHPVNRGKGAALLTGMAAALEQQCDWALTIDGDGQHNPADAPALLAAAVAAGRCLVIGRRQGMAADANVPWTSRFGREFSNFWVFLAGGPRVSDSQSGFRLYPLPEVLQWGVRAQRYQFEVEVLVRAQRQGVPTIEVPVGVVYQARGTRVSHFRPWRDFLRNSFTFSRLIRERIVSLFCRR